MIASIRSIIDRLRGKATQTGHAYDLSDSDIVALRQLATDEHFQVFVRVLDARVKIDAEVLLLPSAPSESVHFCRGKLAGLRAAGTLVDEIITQESHLAASRSRSDSLSRPERASAAARFASPFNQRA